MMADWNVNGVNQLSDLHQARTKMDQDQLVRILAVAFREKHLFGECTDI